MASEDFGVFGRACPACFVFLGNGVEAGAGGTPLHSHDYDFNDDILGTGVAYYVNSPAPLFPPGRRHDARSTPPRPGCPTRPATALDLLARPARRRCDFHRGLAGYAPTPLVDLPALAAELGVGRVLVKDESTPARPARVQGSRRVVGDPPSLRARRDADGPSGTPVTLVAATDGNHGRAVARFARLLGHRARHLRPGRRASRGRPGDPRRGRGRHAVPADYDDAVRPLPATPPTRRRPRPGHRLGRATKRCPRWIVDGYSTLFAELDDQLADLGARAAGPRARADRRRIAAASRPHSLPRATGHGGHGRGLRGTRRRRVRPGQHRSRTPRHRRHGQTIMAGLNCGTVSASPGPSSRRSRAAITVTEEATSRGPRPRPTRRPRRSVRRRTSGCPPLRPDRPGPP